MAYDAHEISNYDGAPVHLYEFYRNSTFWRYVNADRDVPWGGNTYTAIPIADGGVVQDSERNTASFEVRVPASNPVAQLYRSVPPTGRVWLRVRRLHYGDDDAKLMWVGAVAQVSLKDADGAEAVLSCQSVMSMFSSRGNRLTWGRQCPHMLYDTQCKVAKATFAVAGTAAGVTGSSINVSAAAGYPDGRFSGGIVEFTRNGFSEFRTIQAHVGGSLKILGLQDGITNGMAVTIYPGCRRTIEWCNDVFGNKENFGGIRHMPFKSPFTGQIVF